VLRSLSRKVPHHFGGAGAHTPLILKAREVASPDGQAICQCPAQLIFYHGLNFGLKSFDEHCGDVVDDNEVIVVVPHGIDIVDLPLGGGHRFCLNNFNVKEAMLQDFQPSCFPLNFNLSRPLRNGSSGSRRKFC
jgi:hypothetical protein